ncbi:hypothetical protein BAUCODRAFT_431137 [Baudoinia panamericana UAMH 10762]|uniref:Uncharacterized protein n=1 Tax=Baudoinia panamericana (strain UAMH 10762) TaxID=717646 RepID=M2NCH1_BAUPA|nr:uncharacterized protein BAUCODRAFT_431137 [Baudoinia panamericana UAMH 10762]EMC96879.1 hypothetical protein BAUCODRAFT_431137 [Baudoinia panamericana UAMH 10762]
MSPPMLSTTGEWTNDRWPYLPMYQLRNQIHLRVSLDGTSPQNPLLVYFITGNPGVIQYYGSFMMHLKDQLATRQPGLKKNLIVHGASLDGFQSRPKTARWRPYDLREQIAGIRWQLALAVGTSKGQHPDPMPVILVGHSIGAYMLIEAIARERERATRDSFPDQKPIFNIIGGICLFPTITDLGSSGNGVGLWYLSWLLAVPGFLLIFQVFVRLLTGWMPYLFLDGIVSFFTGYKADAARTTSMFLKSRQGVRQALYLARCELNTLKANHEPWTDALWGTQQPEINLAETALEIAAGGDCGVSDITNLSTAERKDSTQRSDSSASSSSSNRKVCQLSVGGFSGSSSANVSPTSPARRKDSAPSPLRQAMHPDPENDVVEGGAQADAEDSSESSEEDLMDCRRRSISWSADIKESKYIAKRSKSLPQAATAKSAATCPAISAPVREQPGPPLYFYWGRKDHWVADETRDRIIRKRAMNGIPTVVRRGSNGKEAITGVGDSRGTAVMEIDSYGIPHDFPVRENDSKRVAEKVAAWVEEIVERQAP